MFVVTFFLILGFISLYIGINYMEGQYKISRKRQGGLWMSDNRNFWITSPSNFQNSDIPYFIQKGWKFEDYR